MTITRYRIKNIATLNDEVLYDTTDPETEIRYVEIGDVRFNEGIVNKTDYTYETAPSRARRVVRDGDVIISTVRTYLKAVAPIRNPEPNLIVSTGFAVVRPNTELLCPAFAGYLLLSEKLLSEVVSRSVGVSYPAVNPEDISNLEVYLPPLSAQKAIAAYLDKETARIDALIAKKERQIELLEEKRQAIITRAITKGLDPKAKMKDSGVEWIGEIPEEWQVRKFSHCVAIQEGQVDPEQPPYSSMLLIAPNHIESNTGRLIYRETAEEQGAESGKYYCRIGDVVYSKIRPKLAKATIAPEECLCSADMYPMRGKGILLNDYLLLILISDSFTKWAVLESDRVAMPKLNRETMNDFYLPIPPIEQQRKTIEITKALNDSIFIGIDKIKKSLQLLQEYRSSLITAAVSGQIDVSQEVVK